MTDPIANLIAAARTVCQAIDEGGGPTQRDMQSLRSAIYRAEFSSAEAAKAAAEARPEKELDDACDFYAQLPKGPTHGRFSASDRAELDGLKRKAFESARPEPAAEPSDKVAIYLQAAADCRMNKTTDDWQELTMMYLSNAVEALAREVRK